MTQWKCSHCDYLLDEAAPPERCPSCGQACVFTDVTCYIPDCGGPGKIDPRLAASGGAPGDKKESA
jgi:rubredoxin